MQIIIDIKGTTEDNAALLDQVQAAQGWTGMTVDAIAQKYSETLAAQIISTAKSGREIIDRRAKEAEVTALAAKTVAVSVKAG
jgi:predicted metal-dependent TIM-barrel fold hydrolase